MGDLSDHSAQRDDLVIGRGPVLELLGSDRPVECIFLQKGLQGTVTKIAAIAKEQGVPVKDCAVQKLDSLCGNANHQGVVAQLGAAHYSSLDDLFDRATASGEPPFILLADGVEDPHNLGAIIRTAEASGAHGLIIPKRRSAGLNYTVSKTSAGAVAHLPVARVSNLVSAIEELKKRGLWVYAADMDGESWCSLDYTGPVALVLGAEGSGISRLVRKNSDYVVSLPLRGQMNSLNVSVAAGVLCYEIARQRMQIKAFQK